ncbi:FAD-dependent oxidoreductase [Subtercola boreus]|uniref:Pyridine nucleotide-disulfide oxidoreductase n=1 Tax=Subtercola boreus TaxID=120213 RepID=A0A3E0WA05_9MICO|nr:FAD-dependent oxidoreductase [Subtercola boreus]RFA19836.1 pyridine nucleotide-disulfide oxidoreductase [Subtercola boreus]RFA19903.1 pyridine nucleotide-disulfide oxidoreductase [Subtercola boreus]RFA26296.1 pyridine nucleotide-disulfide oxidoreductase [Subtercola boreus]
MTVPDVLVIGAGPAGLAAARAARRRGASVTLLDSSDELGGQYWRHLPPQRPSEREAVLHHGWSAFTALREWLERSAGVTIIRQAYVWAIETREGRPGAVFVVVGEVDGEDRPQLVFEPGALILATGAYDRTLPFPGWDLPGVFTAGAAQALAKGERVAIGRRVVVAGAGPFLLPVAASLAATGSTVLGVYEANRTASLIAGWLPRPWQLLRAARKGGELAGYVRGHLRHRIPYRVGKAVIRADGTDRVETVTIASVDAAWSPLAGTEQTIAVDAVCVGHGFTPRLELAIAAGCALSDDDFVWVDERQQTSIPLVFAAGEVTGIGGVDLALAEGEIAGHLAAGGSIQDAALAPALAHRRTYRSFASRIENAHGVAGGWSEWLTPDTVVCRCEEVTYGVLCDAASATGGASLRSLKLSSRAGLGICQGRVCGRTIEDLIAKRAPGLAGGPGHSDAPVSSAADRVRTDRRPIAVPIRLGELAAEPTPLSSPSLSDRLRERHP